MVCAIEPTRKWIRQKKSTGGSLGKARCKAGEEVWYGPWGFEPDNADEELATNKKDKVYARLTYNPYFDRMVDQLLAFTGKAKVKAFCKTY